MVVVFSSLFGLWRSPIPLIEKGKAQQAQSPAGIRHIFGAITSQICTSSGYNVKYTHTRCL